jgi:hypothetical protein
VRVGYGKSNNGTLPPYRGTAFTFDSGGSWFQGNVDIVPDKGGGTVAAAANASRVLWAPDGAPVSWSSDNGNSWHASANVPQNSAVASDRVNANKFYGLGGGKFWVSTDGGATFTASAASGMPESGEVRAVFGREGDVWVAGGAQISGGSSTCTICGLWHTSDSGATFIKLANVDDANAIGFGMAKPGGSGYPAIFLAGKVQGVRAIFRSDDMGATWINITDAQHQYATIQTITGDPRIYGRVYFGTNGLGMIYGDISGVQQPTSTYTPVSPSPGTVTITPSRTNTPTPTRTNTPTFTATTPPVGSNTGWISPSGQAAQSGGDGNGFEGSPANAFADGGGFATDTNSGTGTSTSCTSTSKDRHAFFSYPLSIPAGSTITGIEVRTDARVESSSSSPHFCVQLSWDNGTTWTALKTGPNLTTTERSDVLGSSTDTWGRTWNTNEMTSANFRVRIVSVSSSTSRDFSLDWIPVRVWYTDSGVTVTPTFTSTPTRTNTPTPTATFCALATAEPLWVEPVTSPTDLTSQVITVRAGNSDSVTVTHEFGSTTVTGSFSTANPAQVTVPLQLNATHHLTVSAHIRSTTGPGGCTYGNYTLRTSTDRYGAPLTIVQSDGSITPTWTPTATATLTPGPGACSPVTATITAPFTYDGPGTFCWQTSNLGSYVNSWNLASLTINGVNFTNQYVPSGSYPARINGFWYVSYTGNFAWSHFEAK